MFDTIKCRSCGAENKKNSKFCAQCGQLVAGQLCGKCGQTVRAGATFCSSCGAKVEASSVYASATYPEEFPDLSKSNVWQRRPNDLAHRFEARDLNSYFAGLTKKITVMQGTKAIFLQGGKYQGDLPPGTYTADSLLEFLKTLNFYEKTTIILVDDGDIPVDFSIGGLRTSENFDAGVKGKMVVKVDKPILLFDNLMKSRPHLEIIDLLSNVRNELLNVLQSKIKGYSFEDLYGNLDLRKELQQDFEFNLTTTLSRWGLQLIHLPYFDYDESYWQDLIQQRGALSRELIEKREKIKREADIGLLDYDQSVATKVKDTEIKRADQMIDREREMIERKRFDEITKLFRERLTDDKMNEFQNAEDLEKYINSIDKERAFRQNEMTDLKILFETNRQDEAVARKLMLERMAQSHQLAMKSEVIEEEVKGRRFVNDYNLEKRGKVSGQDVKEAEAGIELLWKMKAAKREDATGYQSLELGKAQKAADIEAQRLKARSTATDEAQISMAEEKVSEQLAEIAKMKPAKALTEEQLMTLSAKDSAAVATALKEKYGSDQVKAMYEPKMKDQEAYVQRMQQMKEKMSPVTGAIVKDSVITSSKVTKLDPINVEQKRSDPVHFTVTGPHQVKPKSSFILNIWAHLENQLIEVNKRAKESNANQPILVKTIGPHLIPQGIKIAFNLEIENFIVDNPEECVLWNGDIASANFLVKVPDSIESGVYGGTIRIFTDGISIARVNFLVEVNNSSSQRQLSDMPYDVFRYRKAFVSYSSKDRNQVLARIQGIQKVAPNLEIKMDIKDLRSGENWKEKLREFIDQCDIFYLFWSQNAKESPWVEKEWKCAYKHKGIDFIDPVPLESPEHVPPPSELSGKHFNDWVLAYIRTINS